MKIASLTFPSPATGRQKSLPGSRSRVTGRGYPPFLRAAPLAAAVLITAGVPYAAAGTLFSADFEKPHYQPGTIHGQNGWEVEQGLAEVDSTAGRGGGAGLVMRASEPFSQATLKLEAPWAGSPVFLDLFVLPVATEQEDAAEMLDIDGARIGFFRPQNEPELGRFWIFNGDGKGGGSWVPTEAVLPVDAQTGKAARWARLTLREDFGVRSWDLWVNGELSGPGAGFHDAATEHTRSYVIMGDALEHLAVDDLSISNENPLGADKDRDGMLDEDEQRIGSNPELSDREGRDAAGTAFHDKWLKLLAERRAAAAIQTPEAPAFSTPSCLVESPFRLTLTAAETDEIRYTTDGSEPQPGSGLLYREALEISGTTVIRTRAGRNGKWSATATAAWVFASQVTGQQRPAGWPGALNAEGPRAWPLDPRMRVPQAGGAQVSGGEVAEALRHAPVVVLAVPPDQLFGAEGIYEKSLSPLKASGAVVWMHAESGRSGGAGAAGLQISGESSRSHEITLKHSLRVTLPETADAGMVFGEPSLPARQFVLRHPTQDSWAVSGGQGWHRDGAKYVMDAWASGWLAEQGHPALRHQWVHVFLNSTYWGVYDAVEQYGAGGGRHLLVPDPGGSPRAVLGSAAGWNAALQRLRALAALGESAPDEQWEQAVADVDVPGLVDYMLWNWWLGNYDWPLHNWLLSQENGKWSFLSWDAELSGNRDRAAGTAEGLATDAYGPGAAFTALSAWAGFRDAVRMRGAELTAEGGALSLAGALESLSVQEKAFAPLVAAESARWGWVYQTPALLPGDWARNMAALRQDFIPRRGETLRQELEQWLSRRMAESRRRENPPAEPVEVVPAEDEATRDSDGDGIPDVWERRFGLDPLNAEDALADTDADGLNNFEEFARGSDPLKKDVLRMLDESSPGVHSKFSVRKALEELRQPLPGQGLPAPGPKPLSPEIPEPR